MIIRLTQWEMSSQIVTMLTLRVIEDSGEVKIYYGASDTTQCLATAQLDELIEFCLSFR